jgi:hypothetical protein
METEYNGAVAHDATAVEDRPATENGDAGQNGNGLGQDVLALLQAPQTAAPAYDSFDHLMQDTTAHSAELLRRVLALPTLAHREVTQVRAEAEQRIRAEQDRQRGTLTGLIEEMNGGRQRAELLAQGVAALLEDLTRLSQRANEALADVANTGAASSRDASTGTANGFAPAEGVDASLVPFEVPTDEANHGDDAGAEASGEGDPAAEANGHGRDGVETRPVSLIVHGARPTAALSLRRYLAGLPHVAGVEVREYSDDALNAQLMVERPMTADDFEGWGNGAKLEIVNLADDTVELKLAAPRLP